jgi:hypothetical protein
MKKYIIITEHSVFMRDELSKRDLIDCKNGLIKIINTVERTFYTSKSDEWFDINKI